MSGLWGSVFSFAAYTLTPKLYAIGPLLWPFALCNGLTAGAAYAAIDSASGGPTGKILGNPLAGVGIGVTVAAFAPHFLYGPALSHLYGIEDASGVISSILQFPFVQSVTLATGAAAGLMIYPVLYFPINGIKGVPWAKFSLPPLLAAAAATYWVFSPDNAAALPVPPGAHVPKELVPLLEANLRLDTGTGRMLSYSWCGGGFWAGPAGRCAEGRRCGGWWRRPTISKRTRLNLRLAG